MGSIYISGGENFIFRCCRGALPQYKKSRLSPSVVLLLGGNQGGGICLQLSRSSLVVGEKIFY